MEKECSDILKKLVNKKYLLFVHRGNTAVKMALLLAKSLGRKKILIQDQGGWLTYSQFIGKLKLDQVELKTDCGIVNPISLYAYKQDSVLLIHTAPAYCSLQPLDEILQTCKKNNILFFNDATGSIGHEQAKQGDVVFASFGEHKPINLGEGAFIATDNLEYYNFLKQNNSEVSIDFDALFLNLRHLDQRLQMLSQMTDKIKKDLKNYNIVHRESKGINVIVKYMNEPEKQKIIKYCEKNNLEYRECPLNIRINEPAISIEVKRK